MRILIDECLNWRLSCGLANHCSVSAQKMSCGDPKGEESRNDLIGIASY